MNSPAAAFFLAALAISNFYGAAQAACHLTPQGEGRVANIIDARTFRLDDGREIRLAGIETNVAGHDAGKTWSVLTSLIDRRDVVLQGDGDTPDRYGRQSAVVFIAGADKSLQTELFTRGVALMALSVSDSGCAEEWKAAEGQARIAKRGLWADGSVTKKTEMPGDILANIGRMTVVEGKVLSARQAGATFYINFGQRWTQDFAVTISRRMMPLLEASGFDPKTLEGKTVRIRGWIEKRGGPRIDVTRVSQIEMIGAEGGAEKSKDSVAKDLAKKNEGK